MTFADPEASRVLWPHLGAEDGGGEPEELQRGGDSAHEGCRGGWECQNRVRLTQRSHYQNQIKGGAAGRTEQGRHADGTKLGKLQAHVNGEGAGKSRNRSKYLI